MSYKFQLYIVHKKYYSSKTICRLKNREVGWLFQENYRVPEAVHILISRNVLFIISGARKFSIKELTSLKSLLGTSWHSGKHFLKSAKRIGFEHLPQEIGKEGSATEYIYHSYRGTEFGS